MSKQTPNSVKRDKSKPPQFDQVEPGMYVFSNAYDGHYEYFRGKELITPTKWIQKMGGEICPKCRILRKDKEVFCHRCNPSVNTSI